MKNLKKFICVLISLLLIFTGLIPVGATPSEEEHTDDGEDEEFMSFTLTKTEDYKPAKIGFFRKIGGILAGWLSTVYGIYVNADRYFSLKEDGYKAPFFEFVF